MPQPDTKFAIIAMPRTGTNALVTALKTHENCYAEFEIFHNDVIYGPLAKDFTVAERDADTEAFLDFAVNAGRAWKSDVRCYGFKIFFGHNDAVMERLIKDPSWSLVLLRRENTLDQFLSLQIAFKTDVWNTGMGDKVAKVWLDEKKFLAFNAEVDGFYAWAERLLIEAGGPWTRFSYDDMAAGTYGPLCEFLSLEPPHDIAPPKLKKQNPPRTADKLENPDEVCAMLVREGLTHFWVD